MTSKRALLRQQRRWAESFGLQPDSHGYLETVEQNLRRPLSTAASAAFERGNGSELKETSRRPAKMRALHSSAALAVNVFDHWTGQDARPLLQALGLDSTLKSLDFEKRFPTGLTGPPPNLDVTLELSSGKIVAIESKFTEWMTPKPRNKPAFKDKYFDGESHIWTGAGLPACQALATNLFESAVRFRYLNAAQLLKHALGLATQHAGKFALYYLYFDVPSSRSTQHQEEISHFRSAVDTDVEFKAFSYQDFFSVLQTLEVSDSGHIAYLSSRYF